MHAHHINQPDHVPNGGSYAVSRWAVSPDVSERRQRVMIAATIFLVSAAMHFVRLRQPAEVIFDEVHFGKQVSSYCCTHERFMDVHPPMAKLPIVAILAASTYSGDFQFSRIGESYGSRDPALFRAYPALLGTLIPLLLFFIALQLGASTSAALLTGAFATLDNALLVQTRVISLDGSLLFWTFVALSTQLAIRNVEDRARGVVLSIATGAAVAMAVGSKFTGLAAFGIVGVVSATRMFRDRSWRRAREEVRNWTWLSTAFVAVYLTGWWVHFALLTVPGKVPDWGLFDGNGFLADVIRSHLVMLRANANLSATHPDYSHWWAWPFMWKPIPYWRGNGFAIEFIGNPAVWWGSTFALVAGVSMLLLTRTTSVTILGVSERPRWPMIIAVLCYAGAMAPLTRVARGLFLYHYFTPLLASFLILALAADRVGFTRDGSIWRQRRVFYGVLLALCAGFVLMAPLTYGLQSPWTARLLALIPMWR